MSPELSQNVEKVTVVGAGTMGHGIAQTFATAGYDVVLNDVDDGILENALQKIRRSLEKVGEDVESVVDRIELTTANEKAYADVDLIVEAVPEDINLKQNVFKTIDHHAPDGTVLATNTSTLPITEIAETTGRPQWVVGMHFSNPVQLMPIVEIISGEQTSDEVFIAARAISKEIEKTPVLVEKDVPGFVLNRINLRFWLEAIRQVQANVQDPKTIDAAIQRIGFPMGPFEVLDYSGIDVVTMAAESMQERGVDLHIPDLLKEKVEGEKYGMKTGEGFYKYPEAGRYSRVDIPHERRYDFDPKDLFAPAVNEAAWLLATDITTRSEIDKAMKIGMNWQQGLLELADKYGIDRLVAHLEDLERRSGWPEYAAHSFLRKMVEKGRVGLASGEGFYEWEYEQHDFKSIQYERREYLAWITMNQADVRNTLDEPSWQGLKAAFEHAAEDDAVRATIIQGGGRGFSTGVDIAKLQCEDTQNATSEIMRETIQPTVDTIREHPKPVIAAVDQRANGGGSELVLLSDLAVASDSSKFTLPEAHLGVLPPLGLTYGRMSLGKKAIMELALTNTQLSAHEADQIGIVNHTVAGNQVEDVAREFAEKTTASAPGSVSAMKELWTNMEDDLLNKWIEEALQLLIKRSQSEETKRGLSAFLENEDPYWKK